HRNTTRVRLMSVSSSRGDAATCCRPLPTCQRPSAAGSRGTLEDRFMFNLWGSRQRTDCDGATRRDVLKAGVRGATGRALPALLRARAAAQASGRPTRNTSVVWLWLGGGPTHVETFDPKMSAPAEFRSVVGAVRTNVPGIELGGVLPRMARVADKMAFVRSFAHRNSGHGGG